MTELTAANAQQFIAALPYAQALGIGVEDAGPGRITLSMPHSPETVGDPATGVVHGGAVFALLDTASGAAVLLHPDGPASTATLDLRIDYMRPATAGQRIRAEAVCYHTTRTVAFIRATAWDEDPERPVAMAAGAFTLDPRGRHRGAGA